MTEAPGSTAPPPTLDRTTTQPNAALERRRTFLEPRAAIIAVIFLAIIGWAIWA
jgi:hypothetical protein